MHLIDRILEFFRGKEPEPEYEKVEFSGIMQYLADMHREEMHQISKEEDFFKNRILSDFASIREINESLSRIKAFDVLSRASVEVKNNFCEKTRAALSKLPGKELDSADFMAETRALMEKLNALTPRQAAHIGMFFKEHVNRMAEKMRSISSTLDEYDEFITTSMVSDMKEIEKMKTSIDECEKKISYIEKNISDIENEAAVMRVSEQKQASKIPQLDKEKIEDLKEYLASLSREKKSIEQEIDTMFGSLSRLMKKHMHELADKKTKAILEKYVESPSWAFLTFDKDMGIKKALYEIKNAVEAKKLESDEKQYVHLCSMISNMPQLKKTRDKYGDVMEKISEKEAELVKEEKVYDKVSRLGDELKDVRGKISERNLMKQQLGESKARLEEEIRQKLKEMEFIINSDMGVNVKIIYDFKEGAKNLSQGASKKS